MHPSLTSKIGRAAAVIAAMLIATAAILAIATSSASAEHEHTYSEWQIDTLATSNAKGEAHRTCTTCGATDITKLISTSDGGVERIAGATRYATSADISAETFDDISGVIIATGENFPDALAASALAGMYEAPVILTKGKALSSEAQAEIDRLGAKYFTIVGGTSAISSGIESELVKKYGEGHVQRISGNNRYATALEIYKSIDENEWNTTAIVATGANYPDALSVSSCAYWHCSPIFLVNPKTGLDADTKAALESGNFDSVLIVGGANAVSAATEATLIDYFGESNVERISGDNRYETSKAIAEYALDTGSYLDDTCIATGKNFPDALSGCSLAGWTGALMLLVDDGHEDALEVLENYADDISKAYILGGTNAVSTAIQAKVEKIVGITLPSSIDFTDAKLLMSTTDYDYTGEAIVPDVTVTYGNKTLTEGVDYTVSCSNNVEIGTATVTITGAGSFTADSLSKEFSINKPIYGSGTCGTNASWVLYQDGTLEITGTGEIKDYTSANQIPWKNYLSKVKNVTIAEGITSIGGYAFNGCSNLESISIPSSVNSICQYAFYGCYNMTSITIPKDVKSIRSCTFMFCTKLESVTFAEGSELTSIADQAFSNCTALASISIPKGVTSISQRAFYTCTGLSSVTFATGNELSSIGDYAFYNCTSLTSISIPNTVTVIGEAAFSGCEKLETCNISITASQLETISQNAFHNCYKLASINIPSSVTNINSSAFSYCKALKTVTFSELYADHMLYIGNYAFDHCTSLPTITIPSRTSYIGNYAFDGCTKLATAYLGTSTNTGTHVFPSTCDVTYC